jgi:outer membrane immunogenic protein
LRWFATFRGRAGILADPQTLLYATGDLAVGEFKYSAQTTSSVQVFTSGLGGTTPNGPPFVFVGAAVSSSDTRAGWTAGAGVERKFSPNWSGKLEYLYMDFGTKTYFAGTANQADVSFHDHIFRAGFNYAFNPAPVVAKY